MIDRLKALFSVSDGRPRDGGAQHDEEELRLAAAALLVEAALGDGDFDDEERGVIEARLAAHFGLSGPETSALIASAETAVADTHQLLPYTRVIKNRFDMAERIRLVEMLWEVVYADDRAHDYEASLLRRIAGRIYISDRESGAARKRVLARRERDRANGPESGAKRDQG